MLEPKWAIKLQINRLWATPVHIIQTPAAADAEQSCPLNWWRWSFVRPTAQVRPTHTVPLGRDTRTRWSKTVGSRRAHTGPSCGRSASPTRASAHRRACDLTLPQSHLSPRRQLRCPAPALLRRAAPQSHPKGGWWKAYRGEGGRPPPLRRRQWRRCCEKEDEKCDLDLAAQDLDSFAADHDLPPESKRRRPRLMPGSSKSKHMAARLRLFTTLHAHRHSSSPGANRKR